MYMVKRKNEVMTVSVEELKRMISSYYSARGLFIPTNEMEIGISTGTLMRMLLRRLFVWMTIPALLVQSIKEVIQEDRHRRLWTKGHVISGNIGAKKGGK